MFDVHLVVQNLVSVAIDWLATNLLINSPRLSLSESGPFGLDTSIEGMSSQQFSVGVFYFLIVAIIVFTAFVFLFMFKSGKTKLKTGEKWLFAWLLLGIFVAVIFGATQMLQGYLF